MIIGRKRRVLREQWLRWSRLAYLYREAEETLEEVAAGRTRQVHRYDFPVYFCSDQPGLQPLPVHAEVRTTGVRLTKLRQLPNGGFESLNIMTWYFGPYDAHVSDDGTEVRFRSADPGAPGNAVYVKAGVVGVDLGFRVNVALGIRRDGLDQYRQILHNERLAHLHREPDRSAPSARDLRMHEGGGQERASVPR